MHPLATDTLANPLVRDNGRAPVPRFAQVRDNRKTFAIDRLGEQILASETPMSTQGIATLFGMAANTIAAKIAHHRPAKAQLNPMLSDRLFEPPGGADQCAAPVGVPEGSAALVVPAGDGAGRCGYACVGVVVLRGGA